MTVERTQADHQTRYELYDQGELRSVLTYTADPNEPATWKILLPGPGGTENLYSAERFPSPDAAQLEAWLTPLLGSSHASQFSQAVNTDPPPPANWHSRRRTG